MTGLRVYNLTMRVLKEICGTAENLQDLIDKDIVKAELLVKFKKPKSMDDEEYAKALSATLKPVSDLENVKISTNDGATIEAGSALKVRRVDIEKQSDGNQINQPQLEQELERFLLDLRSHNENH